jgi:hypothetical protein
VRIHKWTGYWCKKINKQVFYFERVKDAPKGKESEKQLERVKENIRKGRDPFADKTADKDAYTVGRLASDFLNFEGGAVGQRRDRCSHVSHAVRHLQAGR